MVIKAGSIEITTLGTQNVEETAFDGEDTKGITSVLTRVLAVIGRNTNLLLHAFPAAH